MTDSDTTQAIAANAWVEVDFSPDPGYQLIFDGIHAHEELGRPFLFEIDLSSGTLRPDIGKLVGTSATTWLAQSEENSTDRFFNGIVTRVVSSGLSAGAYRYRIEVRPWIWLLTRVTDCRILQNLSPFQIITKIFRDAGFSDFKDGRQAGSGDSVLEFCVQYRETSFDFVTRLMEQYGLYYFFKHDRGQHTLVIADDPNAHDTLPDAIPFVFDQTEFRTVADHIWEWSTDLGLYSGKFTFRDYNFKTPSADLTAKTVQNANHPYGSFEVYEYPGPYDDTGIGQGMSDTRMQDISRHRTVLTAVSNARALHPGWRFDLSHHPERPVNRDYLITKAEFSMSIAEGSSTVDGETIDTYRVTIQAIPGDVPFRLERLTPRPLIRGPQTAKVVGKSGDEIDPDQYGRVKVKFHWDRSDTQDDQRTCWIRVAQPSAGAGWGSIYIPRIGQEVVVEFLEGNPDRPLITGVVYNANMTVPYTLPDNKTRTTIKTNSSKGGNGFNELRFEDLAGQEEVFFQAQKDFTKKVLNNETVTIHKDTTTTVETGDRKVTVSQGGDTLTVSTGDHTITVSAGKSSVTAAQSITLSVGANSVKIDTSGVTINGMQVQLQSTANMSMQAGAAMSMTASASMSLTAPTIALN
jgi:type VI secretion system secreted protein VgrG